MLCLLDSGSVIQTSIMYIYETHFPNGKTKSSITTMIESDEQPKYKYDKKGGVVH